MLPAVRQQGFQLPGILHHRPQAVLVDQGIFGGVKHTFQQHNRLGNTGFTQGKRFFNGGHGKAVGQIGQRLGATHGTVAVGIGFEHRQHFAAVHGFEGLVVLTQVV